MTAIDTTARYIHQDLTSQDLTLILQNWRFSAVNYLIVNFHFQCPDNKWLIDNKEYTLEPVCKTKAGELTPEFYATLTNDEESIQNRPGSTLCKHNTVPIRGKTI